MQKMTDGNDSGTKIKICGLRRREDILAVNEAKPDYCGFIIEFPSSFRSVTVDEVRELVKELDPEIRPVGVFVNAPMELVRTLLDDGTLALAQLHGQEDESYIRELKTYTDKLIIKAFSIKTAEDIEESTAKPGRLHPVGSRQWRNRKDIRLVIDSGIERPFFLAGGIGALNMKQAICEIRPYAVDLSSSVETEKWKDPKKIRQVVDIVRRI